MPERPVALVTGASRGIGKAIALELARLGYDIVISHFDFTADGKPDEATAQQALCEITAVGARCAGLRADVSNPEERRKLVDLVRSQFGRCDFLMNNAGVAPLKRTDLLEATEESFDRVLRINLKGPYFLTQIVANWMIQQKKEHPERMFRICNTASMSSYTSSTGRGEYCISKAGVSMATMLWADRLAEFNIGVFEVRPGIIATDIHASGGQPDRAREMAPMVPVQRAGSAEEVAQAILWLLSDAASYTTASTIDVTGGR